MFQALQVRVEPHRNALVHGRVTERVGCGCVQGANCSGCGLIRQARVGALSDTASDVVWILGIGFGLYIVFGSIIPALFGAAAKTKHSYKHLRHGPHGRAEHHHMKGHTPEGFPSYSHNQRNSAITAEFEPYEGAIETRRHSSYEL